MAEMNEDYGDETENLSKQNQLLADKIRKLEWENRKISKISRNLEKEIIDPNDEDLDLDATSDEDSNEGEASEEEIDEK